MIPDSPVVPINTVEAIKLHDFSIERFGGSPGLRDRGLLESALHQPLMMIEYGDDNDLEIHNLAAAYFFHIIKNHPFVDGNKRAGVLTMIEFLTQNGFEIEISFEELYQLAIDTAASTIGKPEIAAILKKAIARSK